MEQDHRGICALLEARIRHFQSRVAVQRQHIKDVLHLHSMQNVGAVATNIQAFFQVFKNHKNKNP